ncbi:signal peptidase I [Enterococcus sp. 7F3_DIV0205]|uniref:Signal peptidase I n=1 Tax=Candidatus Enterococcus palustris TaxID=1834189 RepID=A0AAQ3W988_9ENTE|nr:signal peptidase I [Enterococcus sp. 7F3_DIV0205]OTN82482.1 hypothetical protein A5821_002393 [Enterococcus sp. 7F3_DIV0205]
MKKASKQDLVTKSKKKNEEFQKPKTKVGTKKKKRNKPTRPQAAKQKQIRIKKSSATRKHKVNHRFSLKDFGKELGITIIIVIGLFLLSSQLFFALPMFEGYGMAPTVSDGDRVYVNRLKKVRRFKLVYFNVPNSKERSIRRVVGLPGEEVSYKNDQLLIDQQPIVERFLATALYRAKQEEELVTEDFSINQLSNGQQQRIPKGKYLVLGDNRHYSTDSRYYGMIDKKDIIGVVETRIWPIYKWRSY